MCDELINIILSNQQHFRKFESGLRLCEIFKSLIDTVDAIGLIVKDIQGFAGDYDLDELTPGNGYRSFVFVVEKAIKSTMQICENLKENREKVFFRKSFFEK